MQANSATTFRVLNNIEKSIRTFNIESATIAWSGENLELRAQAAAYYTDEVGAGEVTKTVYADDTKRRSK